MFLRGCCVCCDCGYGVKHDIRYVLSVLRVYSHNSLFDIPTADAHAIPGTPFCVPLNLPGWLFTYWIPMLVSESVLCALAIYRGVQNTRRGTTLFQTGRKLVATLIRDAVIYFVMYVLFAGTTYFDDSTDNVGRTASSQHI